MLNLEHSFFLFLRQEEISMVSEARYVNEKVVAEIVDCGVQKLRNDRHLRRGIPYCKRRRSVRYFLPDVYAYMEARKIQPEKS